MKGAASRRSQSPIDKFQYSNNVMDSQRGTPVGASDDESMNRSATSSPHSIVQITDEPVNIYDGTSKRSDSLQGVFCLHTNNFKLKLLYQILYLT